MSTLTEFLKQRADKYQAPQVKAKRDEWVESVRTLMQLFEQWLQDAVQAGLLQVTRCEHAKREEEIGSYTVPGLEISTPDGRTVEIIPVGRNVLVSIPPIHYPKARGRVDITDGVERSMLFRTGDEREEWWIVNDRGHQPRVLDKPSFEEALQSLFA